MSEKLYTFSCSCCGRGIAARGPSRMRCLVKVHSLGWGSTSLEHPESAKHICPKCVKTHKTFAPGREFKQSLFAGFGAGLNSVRIQP